jgi:hypothetical protein
MRGLLATRSPVARRQGVPFLLLGVLLAAAPLAASAASLSESDLRVIRESYQRSLREIKGPYDLNYCMCEDGAKEPVAMPDGVTVRQAPCGTRGVVFCAAYRAPWAEALAEKRVYLANIFSRDLYHWNEYRDRHDLIRGYILEDYFIATHPQHKFTELRAYGGLSATEYEAPDAYKMLQLYVALPDFSDFRHYLLAYELQRRYFLRPNVGRIQKVRDLAIRLKEADTAGFKLICDAIHNRISASQIQQVAAYRDSTDAPERRALCDELIAEIDKLTRLDAGDLVAQLADVRDAATAARLRALLPAPEQDVLSAVAALGSMMAVAREAVAARAVQPPDAQRLLELSVTAAAVIHARTSALLEGGRALSVRETLQLLLALSDATYGTGLLSRREREAAVQHVHQLLAGTASDRISFFDQLRHTRRVVEWAQNTVRYSFAEVMPAWMSVMPTVVYIGDDILRASPLLVYAQLVQRLEDHAASELQIQHEILGQRFSGRARALNPGLALGPLRFDPAHGTYSRDQIVALPETPPELNPVAGILTQGEGNVVSHVQLLARALGIPNAVLDPALMQQLAELDGRQVFFLATPMGRVIVKSISRMTQTEHELYAEYTKNKKRRGDGAIGAGAGRLGIDRSRLDLSDRHPVDLRAVRRRDSGVRTGPKAAFLGELKHLFPEAVSRGIVLPFGIYFEHYRRAVVALPDGLRRAGIATPGEPLAGFVERTYAELFGKMVGSGMPEQQISAWIRPRLEIIQHSIRQAPISPALRERLREELERQGLFLDASGTRTVGCFVRSDTNVEDLESFNGAGLNLTIFNLTDFEQILDGLKEVWASPFSYRSFSWRQTLIDEPLWVLPSIVIQESVPSEKSGVLITADLETGDPSRMTIGTSEGVGGGVAGAPAERRLWSSAGTELLAQFKSPWRRLLRLEGGVEVVPSTGREQVLSPAEVRELVAAARTINASIEAFPDSWGRPRPWDVEYGFANGRLWLFQVRPFLGNDEMNNLPALRALDPAGDGLRRPISLEEVIQ